MQHDATPMNMAKRPSLLPQCCPRGKAPKVKRLLLATAAVVALMSSAAAQNHGRIDPTRPTGFKDFKAAPIATAEEIKVDDFIRFDGAAVACRSLEKAKQFVMWTQQPGMAIWRGNERVVSQQAVERYAMVIGCEVWGNDQGQDLWVLKPPAATPAQSMVALCVHSTFVVATPTDCAAWITLARRSVRVSWGAGEKEPRQ